MQGDDRNQLEPPQEPRPLPDASDGYSQFEFFCTVDGDPNGDDSEGGGEQLGRVTLPGVAPGDARP
jgi:hypothetical protein